MASKNSDLIKLHSLATEVAKVLKSHGLILATAESCTGGWVSQTITSVSGSSSWFDRGFVTYSNDAKQEMLGVKPETLKTHGAVSQETVREMAQGAIRHSNANISLALTGIAGPEGGTPQKPIGTVWIAYSIRSFSPKSKNQIDTFCSNYTFTGKRVSIRKKAVITALEGLIHLCNSGTQSSAPPVITLDGPSGTGKGTLSRRLAKQLGWHYLDSGALFRVLAYKALQKGISLEDPTALSKLAEKLHVEFLENEDYQLMIFLDGTNITQAMCTEECGNAASRIAILPQIRNILLEKQQNLRQWPGLVTDGRDMGTVVFPDAILKFFLDATLKERAKRRYQQLKKKGLHVSLNAIIRQLTMRDERDKTRMIAPLAVAPDAILIDTTHLDVEKSFDKILECVKKTGIALN